MTAVDAIHGALAEGATVLIDGATGTELERRGAAMHDGAWCALATETAPDLLRNVHSDYIRAGARVITANTYANSRAMLEPAGLGDRVASLTRDAVRIALEAREACGAQASVAVAGSMSHMMPSPPKGDRWDLAKVPDAHTLMAYFHETATLLAEAGAELLLMEMMRDPEMVPMALQAARETGLPVWVGYSCVDGGDAGPLLSARQDLRFDALLEVAPPGPAPVAGVMHSPAHITGAALDLLRAHTDAARMAYPDSGHFEMPHWNFETVMSPARFVAWCDVWRRDGVQVLGGCCGLGVDHIRALAAHLKAL